MALSKIKIIFDPNDVKKLFSALRRITKVAYKWAEKIPYESSLGYVNAVRKAMSYKKNMIKYNKAYRKWKIKTVGHLNSWQLGGDLISNLKTTKIAEGVYLGGVIHGIMDSGTVGGKSKRYGRPKPKDIAMYGKAVERLHPLFGPELEKYIPKWMKKIKKAQDNIKRSWR